MRRRSIFWTRLKRRCRREPQPEKIAVLFRIHTDARPVVEALLERHISFQMKEHLPNLYNHFIGKDIQAYFRLALGERKRQDFLQVMNRPKRYIGRDSLSGNTVSFEEIRKFYCDREWMMDRVDQFEWDVKMLRKMAPYAAIQYIRKRVGYDDFLKDYALTHNVNKADLFDVLSEIEEAAKPFASIEDWFDPCSGVHRGAPAEGAAEKPETGRRQADDDPCRKGAGI